MGTKQYDNATDLITLTRASSATFVGSNGLIQTVTNNAPRIEYNADGTVKGLLIEEARTNLLPTSNNFSSWNKVSVSAAVSTETSPSGSADAFIVKPTVSTGTTWVFYLPLINTGVVTTISTFAKASGKSFLTMSNSNGSSKYASFNLTTGTVGTVASGYTANMEDFGNGWYRCSVTTPTGFNERAVFAVSDTDGGITSAVNGDDGILLYGAQLEAGSFPTSYIPTSGSTATRARDIATISTSSFGYNKTKGTVAMEFKSNKPVDEAYGAFVLSDGTPSNRIGHYTTSTQHKAFVLNEGSSVVDAAAGNHPASDELLRFCFAFAENNFTTSLNGALGGTDTSGAFASNMSVLALGHYYPTQPQSNTLNGHIKSIKYYPRKLTDAQLQELTT